MERCREGRRGVAGAGPVSAPRRPRTSGFKDTPVGEDGEDVMDDVHNPRLRERPKKDSASSAGPVMQSGSLGSTSRMKRKRQGSQELQNQARSGIVEELDDTTEDTEVGASEDDDDPPPPPIPRRPGKVRPQGKLLDEGIPTDLPTVPRKARTAILKRPQECPFPPVGDSSNQGLTVIPRSPVPVSASPSTPVDALKTGRMKSSSLKLRAVKAPKVSSSTVISEQEVEVAEALFDLARMFTNQSNSSKVDVMMDMKSEPKAESKLMAEPEAKLEASALGDNIVAYPALPFPSSRPVPTSTAVSSPIVSPQSSPVAHFTSPNALFPRGISSVLVPARSTLPVTALTATSVLPVTVPPAEAPKRKRPRLRTRPDLMGYVSEAGLPASSSDTSKSCGLIVPASRIEVELILTSCPPSTDSSSIKVEAGLLPPLFTSVLVSAAPSPISSSEPQSVSVSSPAGLPRSLLPEKKYLAPDNEVKKVEMSTIPSPLHSLSTAQHDRRLGSSDVASNSATLPWEMGQASNMSGDQPLEVDLDGSPTQQPSSAQDQDPTVCGQPQIFDFDLMEPPLTKPARSPGSERKLDFSGSKAEDSLEKRSQMTLGAGSFGQPSWIDIEKGRDGEKHPEHEMQWTVERKYEKEQEREKDNELGQERESDNVIHREGNPERGFAGDRDSFKKMDREEEHGVEELAKQISQQRHGKALKLESRSQKTEKTAVATEASAAVPSLLVSAPLVASNVAPGVSSCPVTSLAIPSWPVGLSPIGYYSSAPAPAVWSSGALMGGGSCVDENIPPGVQLSNPYTIQTRQPQPWKRCASHVYIAHFIDLQQQMNRHPYVQAAYHNSGSLFGAKPYNLNIPLPPAEAVFGSGPDGPLLGCVSGVAEVNVIGGDGSGSGLGVLNGSERNLGGASLLTSAQSKDRAHGEVSCKNQSLQQQQQPQQPSSNLASQSGPGIGFPVTQPGTRAVGGLAASSPASCGGRPVANPGSGGGSVPGGNSASTAGSNIVAGPGASNGGVVNHAVAQAQYLQAVMQQGRFPFPFQAAAHFGPSFSGPPGHMAPQQATQFFGSPFYATHLVHPPSHTQQQIQLGAHGSGGLPSVSKQQQHALQQVGRNFPPGSQQQSTLVPITQLPSQSQQQHAQSTGSQLVQHLTEREGSNVGDSNSSSEGKFSMLQRNLYGQGNPHVTVSAVNTASSVVLAGGSLNLPPQDFNLLSALGAKQQQSQLASQQPPPLQNQPQLSIQHHASGPALHTTFKGIEQQPSQTFSAMSIASMNRGAVVGPGPLGLAPVAAVMAPQGHAMLHSAADPSRGPTQLPQIQQPITAQSHQHSLQSGQQHRGAMQIQKAVSSITSVEDGKTAVDGNDFSNNRNGRDASEDRKPPAKRGMSSSSNPIKVDHDNSPAMQGAPSGSALLPARIVGSGGPTLNLLTPAPAILLSRPIGHTSGSGVQQPGGTLTGNRNSKHGFSRGKLLSGLGGGVALVSSTQSQLSFSDRPSLGPSLPSKIQGTPLSSSGQSIPQSTQVPRHGPTSQHPQLKLSNRSSIGSLPTPSGTAPQAVLAAAIAKSQQVPQQQQSRSPGQMGTNTGSSPRLPSGTCGGVATTTGIPLPPLPPASKSAPSGPSKGNLTPKNSFALPHKTASGVSSKRAAPPSVSHVSSILGPSPLVQNLPLKSFQNQHHSQLPSQQPQQTTSQYHTQPSKLPQQPAQQNSLQSSHSATTTQYHQQGHLNSQQQLHQGHSKQVLIPQQQPHQMQRVFLQNPAFQSLQQPSGSVLKTLPQQQSSPQGLHQTTPPSSQPQQRASSPQQQLQSQQQQPSQQQQYSLQGGPGSSAGSTSNGSLSLGPPTLTLGTGSNGNTSCARSTGSDGLAASQGPGSRSNTSANKMSGPGQSQSSCRSNASGPSFIQAQYVSNGSSGVQQSGSPRNSSGPQYLQTIMNSEASCKVVEQKEMIDGNGQDHVNGMRGLSNSSTSPMPQMTHSGSPGLQPMSTRPLSAGNLVGKSLGVQFSGSNYSEGIGSRSGLSVSPPNLSSSNISQISNSNSNNGSSGGLNPGVHLGVDGRTLFGGSSSVVNQGAISSQGHSGSVHQSLQLVAPGTAASNSQGVGQSSTSGF